MNLVGKIFTVLTLIMSLIFMIIATMVYATHRNWSDLAKQRQQELTKLQADNRELQEQMEREKTRLTHERAARRLAVARLESQVQEKLQEVEKTNAQYTELLAKQRAQTEAVVNAQRQLDQVKAQITALGEEIKTARLDRDQQFARVRDLTDQMHQAEGVRTRLEERLQQLTEDYTQATTVLRAHDLTKDTPVGNIPPAARGEVLAVNTDMIEISLGGDDGIKAGHTVMVSRGDKFLGRAQITQVKPDRAVGRIKYRNAPIQEGDRVQTKAEIR